MNDEFRLHRSSFIVSESFRAAVAIASASHYKQLHTLRPHLFRRCYMAFLTRIYFNAVFGVWAVCSVGCFSACLWTRTPSLTPLPCNRWVQPICKRNSRPRMRTCAACFCSEARSSAAASVTSSSASKRFAIARCSVLRLASYGLVLGAVGGAWACSSAMKSIRAYQTSRLQPRKRPGRYVLHLLGTMVARGLGWLFLGLAIGAAKASPLGRSASSVTE